jgi:hypothetical protein
MIVRGATERAGLLLAHRIIALDRPLVSTKADTTGFVVFSRRSLLLGIVGLAGCSRAVQTELADPLVTNSFAALPDEPEVSANELTRRNPELARQLVPYNGPEQPGTVIVRTNERKLYFIVEEGRAIRYPVGGQPGLVAARRACLPSISARPCHCFPALPTAVTVKGQRPADLGAVADRGGMGDAAPGTMKLSGQAKRRSRGSDHRHIAAICDACEGRGRRCRVRSRHRARHGSYATRWLGCRQGGRANLHGPSARPESVPSARS